MGNNAVGNKVVGVFDLNIIDLLLAYIFNRGDFDKADVLCVRIIINEVVRCLVRYAGRLVN